MTLKLLIFLNAENCWVWGLNAALASVYPFGLLELRSSTWSQSKLRVKAGCHVNTNEQVEQSFPDSFTRDIATTRVPIHLPFLV